MTKKLDSETLEAMFDSMHAQVALLDQDGVIVYVNEAWEKFGSENGLPDVYDFLGINYLEICNSVCDDGDMDAANVFQGIKRVMAGERDEFFLNYPCHAKDQKRWFQLRVTPVRPMKTKFLVVHENVTDLELMRRYQSQLFHTISHDLKMPLNVFIGYANMFTHDEELPSTEEIIEVISAYNQASVYMNAVVNNMLGVGGFVHGKVGLVKRPVQLSALLDHAIAIVRPLLKESGSTLHVDVQDVCVEVDITKMEQVLVNLLGNAIQFTREGEIKVVGLVASNSMEWRVQDNGCGISKEDCSLIFDLYEQALEGRKRPGGAGLGLCIVKKYVALHKGKVWVESELGKGSTFTIQIPV